ncbi:MAG: NAD(P)/FAD-dependent oxidoreductase [Thermoleophilia bacterium]
MTSPDLDCVVVGGGAAGLSAALVLGRARRRVLLVDEGRQSNLSAHAVGGLLGHDGTSPADLYRIGRAQLAALPTVAVRDGRVTDARRNDGGFTVELEAGAPVRAARLLLAVGLTYQLPDLPGLAELWGDSAFHCPFCHGWEVRDRRLALYAGDRADVIEHLGSLLRGWSDDVVAFADEAAATPTARAALEAAGVALVTTPVTALRAEGGTLAAVVLADGSEVPRDAIAVAWTPRPRSDLAARLGAASDERGLVRVDRMGATDVPGLFCAGDACEPFQQVSVAIASGAMAGAAVAREAIIDRYAVPTAS